MELTVLGSYGGFPAKGSACMGHLITTDKVRILLDCGSGVASRLQESISVRDIDAIILSHLHNDHISDMGVLRYAIELGIKFRDWRPVPVYCPRTPAGGLAPMDSSAFDFRFIDGNETMTVGDVKVRFRETGHNIETYASRFEAGSRSLVYTADAPYSDGLAGFARDANVLLAEASLLLAEKGNNPYHMTTAEAVLLGNRARAGQLLLTHFWYEHEPRLYLAEALQASPTCQVGIAEEGQVYPV